MRRVAVSNRKSRKGRKITKISKSSDDTFNIGKELALEIFAPGVIGLTGEVGVGKTVFAKGFAEGLEVKELITSPTFLGISENFTGRVPFIHMDFYKKAVPENIIQAYLDQGSVVLIEWIENFNEVFNKDLFSSISVYVQYLNNGKSKISENERQIIIEQKDK